MTIVYARPPRRPRPQKAVHAAIAVPMIGEALKPAKARATPLDLASAIVHRPRKAKDAWRRYLAMTGRDG
jgi:hypothetical protein